MITRNNWYPFSASLISFKSSEYGKKTVWVHSSLSMKPNFLSFHVLYIVICLIPSLTYISLSYILIYLFRIPFSSQLSTRILSSFKKFILFFLIREFMLGIDLNICSNILYILSKSLKLFNMLRVSALSRNSQYNYI